MKNQWQRLIGLMVVIVLMLGFLTSLETNTTRAQEGNDNPLVELNEENIKQATVFIMQTVETPNGPVITCFGSGTVVSAEGLILTNAHLVEDSERCPSDRIVIGLTLRLDETPVPTYEADIVEFSRGLDLAVLQITRFLDGRIIEQGSLELPFVELGDSDAVTIDETVLVVGYPSLADDPVQSIRGTITGFTAEANYGERSWLRSSVEIPGLMSGGGVYNSEGRLIGIPTITPIRANTSIFECLEIYDTDSNGQIDENDTCIPVGGNISAIRPIRLARGLVRAAALGIELGSERSPIVLPPPENPPSFSRLFVSTGVNEAGMPINVIKGAPTNTNSLFLFFDYDNMEDGMVYELRTTINNRISVIDSLPPVTWSGGRSGMWYIGNTQTPRQNGTYQYTLYIDGQQVAISDPIVIGGGPQETPQFSDIIFGIEDNLQNLVGPSLVIPETNIIRARFSYRNMQPGIQWQQVWYLGDSVIRNETLTWEDLEADGTSDQPAIQSEDGFPSGRYRLELWILDPETSVPSLAATSDFVVAGGAGGLNSAEALIFTNFRFAQGQQANLPLNVAQSFPANTESIYVFFDWRQFSINTPWTWRWYVDDDLLIEERTQWNSETSGDNYFISLQGRPTLPEATYRFEILVGGIPIIDEEIEARIGIGRLPPDLFESAEGVRITGQIVDSVTGKGIPNAIFVVMVPPFDSTDFTWEASQILGRAETDERGFFQMQQLIPRGTTDLPINYSIAIRAEGYLPVIEDAIPITDVTDSPLNFNVELNRD